MKTKNNTEGKNKIRVAAIILISLFVIATGVLFSLTAFIKGDIAGGVGGGFIAVTILVFAIFVFIRGTEALKEGFPLHDERSKKVLERATSKAFFVSLYLLLTVGFLSDNIIKFRDVSQATGISVGVMALLFAIFWLYYNGKEI